MVWGRGITIDKDAGWQELHVSPSRRAAGPDGWLWPLLRWLARRVALVVLLACRFVTGNWLLSSSLVLPLWALAAGVQWAALGVLLVVAGGYAAWFWWAPEAFDRWVSSPARAWWRRVRYRCKWANVMAAGRLTV